MTIVVTGGTGTLGRDVVRRLTDSGRDLRVLSRGGAAPADLLTGDGVDDMLAGAGTVIHCATTLRSRDVPMTENLLAVARRAGVQHLVYISIVGVDLVPLPYYRAKLAVERLVEDSGLPFTILRTTQFHQLVARMWAVQRLPVLFAPTMSFQPIDTDVVAERLVELADGAPAGRVEDMGGPAVETAPDLARTYVRAKGLRRAVAPLWLPGRTFAAYRRGHHLAPEHRHGGDFAAFLARETAVERR